MVALKDLMNSINVYNLDCRPKNSKMPVNIEQREGWLFNPTILLTLIMIIPLLLAVLVKK